MKPALSSPPSSRTARIALRPIAALWMLFLSAACSGGNRLAEHVFIVSFDGGKPAVIAESSMPTLKKLAGEGAVTWSAQTIFPSKTLPSHTSMFTGLTPAKHRVLWNSYDPARGIIQSPTVFTLARKFDPRISTALFAGKIKFRHLWQENSLDVFDFNGQRSNTPVARSEEIENATSPAKKVAAAAAAYIVEKKPQLCGIHFPDPDTAGHKFGWGSAEQKAAFASSDEALGVLLEALQKAGIADKSVLILSADHGGHGRTHGENIPDDMTIPWVAWGKSVKAGTTLTRPVNTTDTTATALWLLGVPIPAQLDGRPVYEAFSVGTTAISR
jgi:predicted AlkP superfamily pyrophosphatase or phosphodiesterase